MRLTKMMVPTLFALAGFLPAQAYNVRGEVGLNSDAGAYFLHCTGWPVAFKAQLPDSYLGKQLLMRATNFGTIAQPSLTVDKFALAERSFRLHEMTIGQKAYGQVFAPLGSYVSVCLDMPNNVGWVAYPDIGVWMLGPDPCGFAAGWVSDRSDRSKGPSQFVFSFMVPLRDPLIGQTFIGQAMVYAPEGLFFTNPDCQTVN